uniref:Uncharacterized protein n=1 Tax=Calcidiscus leptoporus TaxID=127549 RepID=A0A7S0JGV7_9EUKA|mmetsp:Transcript_56301/g.129263  ORF Transcript_56301/g.129263 Transcript_56301/m.129263 type:complete len:293 (+) Transcript_56301:83-961(+)
MAGHERIPSPPGRPACAHPAATAKRQAEETRRLNHRKPSEVCAFGYTFVLAPGFSIRLDSEHSVLLRSFVREQGLAVVIDSELQPRWSAWSRLLPCLSADAQRVFHNANAGGASHISEALSMEVLHRAFGARLGLTELELIYWPTNGAITDFSIELEGTELGVSVTRAFGYGAELSVAQAEGLLCKKLSGVLASTATSCHGWKKQLLHIWCRAQADVEILRLAYTRLAPALVADTVVLVTLCTNLPELYTERGDKACRQPRACKGLKDDEHLRILAESDPLRFTHAMHVQVQ